MRSTIRNICFFVLGGLFVASLMFAALFWPRTSQNNLDLNSLGNPSQGLALIVPPTEVFATASTTPPLNTSVISFIAYYQRVGGWTLADTVPAFISYFDGGNYYDGLVRVSEGSDTYLDVHVRVRADGWILAWFDRFLDDPAAIVYWGHGRNEVGAPPSYSTTLSRAIELVYKAASVGFPGYDLVGFYDYSEPIATRLLIFGHSTAYPNQPTYYYTIPANSTMAPIKLLIRAGGYSYNAPSYNTANRLYVDGGLVYEKKTLGIWGWSTYQIDAFAVGVQHIVQQGNDYNCKSSVAFIMWTG